MGRVILKLIAYFDSGLAGVAIYGGPDQEAVLFNGAINLGLRDALAEICIDRSVDLSAFQHLTQLSCSIRAPEFMGILVTEEFDVSQEHGDVMVAAGP